MSIWILKAAVQKAISLLPFKHQINFLFQKYVTGGVVLADGLFLDKITHCSRHLLYYRKYSPAVMDFAALELGTGWYPIVPIGLYLAGARQVYTIDISPLLSEQRIFQTIEKFIQQAEKGFEFAIVEERMQVLKKILADKSLSKEELLKTMNITAIVGDARKMPLEQKSINLITSNNTFEHIYPVILIEILKEFERILKPGGIMTHAIDMSDHFAHLDHSISVYNFLKFSENEWQWIDNSIQPQNRMRLCEFEKLYNSLNIPITERVITHAGDLSLGNIRLDLRFANYPARENAIVHASLVSKI